MKQSFLLTWIALGAAALFATAAPAAETHKIEATHTGTKPIWKSGNQQSNEVDQPLIVEVKKGDVVEIDINDNAMPHGFVTLNKKGSESPSPEPKFVQTCGQTNDDASLKEIDCSGDASNFNKVFLGALKLEITDKFNEDVHFWCVIHRKRMWGTLKLKP